MSGSEAPGRDPSEWPPVGELARGLRDGRWSSRDLLRAVRERVERTDHLFAAVRGLDPGAERAAEESDGRLAAGEARGPLEGIPVLVKDNIDVSGLPTTAGALALAAARPEGDAHLVARLRQAGAVVAGKTNLSELANFLTEDMPSGYSSLGGQVLNPYDLALTPSGSSSGSASAVALGLVPLAVGTETDGSITSPCAHQSLVGVKPTLGLVSRHGIVPIAPSQDTAGPMARTVADAAALLAAMAGSDRRDPATGPADDVADRLARSTPDPASLGGTRLAVARGGPAERDPDLAAAYQAALAALAGAAAGSIEWRVPEADEADDADELFVLHYEFAPAMDLYLASLAEPAPIRSMRELRDWNRAHPGPALKYGQMHVDRALAMDHDARRDEYAGARARDAAAARDMLQGALDSADADAVVFPAEDGATWAARAGWPCVALPAGYRDRSRRPAAVTVVGRPWSDDRLLSLAAGMERVLPARRPPWEINPAVFRRFTDGR
ncbi:MAG TPA: amidase family protein [Acidimicrobiales bacterium]|nr:amidase family protein [Acidimicrobiales bacterium]